MSFHLIDFDAPGIHCKVHGLRPVVAMPAPLSPECLECSIYARVANTALGKSASNIRVTREMLISKDIKCSVCGDPVATVPTADQWKTGMRAVWYLRKKRLGMIWSNLIPIHFMCQCVIGHGRVETRSGRIERWKRVAARQDDDTREHVRRPYITLSAYDIHAITRQHKALVRRHVARFGCATELTPSDLVTVWRVHGGQCAICKSKIDLHPEYPNINQLSWDRKLNEQGYENRNIQPTCWGCNSAKSMYDVTRCLSLVQQHLAFHPPRYYIQEPGPDVCADHEEVALVKRLRIVYRKPPEVNVHISVSKAEFMELSELFIKCLFRKRASDEEDAIVSPLPDVQISEESSKKTTHKRTPGKYSRKVIEYRV